MKLKDKVVFRQEGKKSIIEEMQVATLPLVMWGGGSMSFSVRKVLKAHGIRLRACWIDGTDGSGHMNNGLYILSYDELVRQLGTFNVIMGFSRYELSLERAGDYPAVKHWFCLTDVCYGQWERMSNEFAREHMDDFQRTTDLLADEESKQRVVAFINCRLNEDFRYILPLAKERISYFSNPYFPVGQDEHYADIGAYTGDTIQELLAYTQGGYSCIYAVEPEEKSFHFLQEYVRDRALERVSLFQCGCWNEATELSFGVDAESSGISEAGKSIGNKIKVYPLDSLLVGRHVTLVKINYLQGMYETIEGMRGILETQAPNLAITVGFDNWSLIRIPPLIKKINPDYKLHLGFLAPMPARLVLFAEK